MGVFNFIFGKSDGLQTEKQLPWQDLSNLEQIEAIITASAIKPQIIFKHSTRCHISKMVIRQFIDNYQLDDEAIDLYYLDLLNHRDVSNEISARLQVWHESPQLLIVSQGEVIAHASHSAINTLDFKSYL